MCDASALTNGNGPGLDVPGPTAMPVAFSESRQKQLEEVSHHEDLPKLHSFAAKEVAGELSLLDAGLLRMIKTSELENGVWMKKDKVRMHAFKISRRFIFAVMPLLYSRRSLWHPISWLW